MSSFKDLRIVDNFYQTSAFYPMPTILVGTLNENGSTNLGAYSLCFPYYIAGKSYYAMILECRNNSNTAQNILARKVCSLNFVNDDVNCFKEVVKLGFPGEESKDKMKNTAFTLENGQVDKGRPKVVSESFQVFECVWDDSLEKAFEDKPGQMDGYEPPYKDFNGITSKFGAHFILKIDKILMKEKYHTAIIDGIKSSSFPRVPVDYGYRDSTNFWYTRMSKVRKAGIPAGKESDINAVIFQANRMHDKIKFTEDACASLVKVPRVFLRIVLSGCIKYAEENSVALITAEHMKAINDKRNSEKNKK